MKYGKQLFKPGLIIFVLMIIFSSCRKSEETYYPHFVSNEQIVSYTQASMISVLNMVKTYYPEVDAMIPNIEDDVNVYKMVYKTIAGTDEIDASGLVCVPATPGEYPVLSFQNGTNTVNASAPSESPSDLFYQLVEYIASMGYVVVIPDYPGFGSSAQIPHPYLIKEPTVKSVVDMLYSLNEAGANEFPGMSLKNEYYLIGYSQGGWATLALHKALEIDYSYDFNLAGSACGAGPYDMYKLFLSMVDTSEYSMPSYIGYIVNAYSSYEQFTNPVSDILNEPYASMLGSLYNGTLSTDEINSQLTTSIPALMKSDFLSGFAASPDYSTVRQALINNSISAWHTSKPLFFGHGTGDTHVSVTTTGIMYDEMINAGTSLTICKKVLYPGLDHGDAVIPFMIDGMEFINNLKNN